ALLWRERAAMDLRQLIGIVQGARCGPIDTPGTKHCDRPRQSQSPLAYVVSLGLQAGVSVTYSYGIPFEEVDKPTPSASVACNPNWLSSYVRNLGPGGPPTSPSANSASV
ncbi:MAG: hypothetical protein ACRD6W_10395, partial [Nitrososphaerales archaeon]